MMFLMRFACVLAAGVFPLAAQAYVGPGAGLSLLGALWGLLAAVAAALVFIVAWPVRRMLRRRGESQVQVQEGHDAAGSPPR